MGEGLLQVSGPLAEAPCRGERVSSACGLAGCPTEPRSCEILGRGSILLQGSHAAVRLLENGQKQLVKPEGILRNPVCALRMQLVQLGFNLTVCHLTHSELQVLMLLVFPCTAKRAG